MNKRLSTILETVSRIVSETTDIAAAKREAGEAAKAAKRAATEAGQAAKAVAKIKTRPTAKPGQEPRTEVRRSGSTATGAKEAVVRAEAGEGRGIVGVRSNLRPGVRTATRGELETMFHGNQRLQGGAVASSGDVVTDFLRRASLGNADDVAY